MIDLTAPQEVNTSLKFTAHSFKATLLHFLITPLQFPCVVQLLKFQPFYTLFKDVNHFYGPKL